MLHQIQKLTSKRISCVYPVIIPEFRQILPQLHPTQSSPLTQIPYPSLRASSMSLSSLKQGQLFAKTSTIKEIKLRQDFAATQNAQARPSKVGNFIRNLARNLGINGTVSSGVSSGDNTMKISSGEC